MNRNYNYQRHKVCKWYYELDGTLQIIASTLWLRFLFDQFWFLSCSNFRSCCYLLLSLYFDMDNSLDAKKFDRKKFSEIRSPINIGRSKRHPWARIQYIVWWDVTTEYLPFSHINSLRPIFGKFATFFSFNNRKNHFSFNFIYFVFNFNKYDFVSKTINSFFVYILWNEFLFQMYYIFEIHHLRIWMWIFCTI